MKGIKSVHFPNYAEKSFMSYEVNGKLMLNLLELITNWQKLYNIQRLTPQISSPLNLCKSRTNASSLIQPLQRRNDITIEICAWRFKLNIIQLQKFFSVTSPDELLLWDAAVAVNVEGFKQLPVAQIIIIKWCNYRTTTLQDNYITRQLHYKTTTQNDNIKLLFINITWLRSVLPYITLYIDCHFIVVFFVMYYLREPIKNVLAEFVR